jgi:hypothetical protein
MDGRARSSLWAFLSCSPDHIGTTSRASPGVQRNFAAAIGEVYGVRVAKIELEHRPRRWFIRAGDFVTVKATAVVPSELPVSCGIPGHDRPGEPTGLEGC